MSILDNVIEDKKREVAGLKSEVPLEELKSRLSRRMPVRDFKAALAGNGVDIIAEVKKASPSRGLLCPDFDPVKIARAYDSGGAAAISVLTESRYFQGNLEYLGAIKEAVKLPVLRKDFILEPYQLYESAACNADAVLLIASVLDTGEIRDLLALAHELGMHCLVEAHNEAEIGKASGAGAAIIGINNRDLDTFSVDIGTTCRLSAMVPERCLLVSESGIHTRQDMEKLKSCGVDAALVGESLVTSPDMSGKIRELRI